MNRGTNVSRSRILDTSHWAYGIYRRHDRNGFVILHANCYFRHSRLFEAFRTYIHLKLLGIHDYMLYRFLVLDRLRDGPTFLISHIYQQEAVPDNGTASYLHSYHLTYRSASP